MKRSAIILLASTAGFIAGVIAGCYPLQMVCMGFALVTAIDLSIRLDAGNHKRRKP